MEEPDPERRKFLKYSLAGIGGLLIGGALGRSLFPKVEIQEKIVEKTVEKPVVREKVVPEKELVDQSIFSPWVAFYGGKTAGTIMALDLGAGEAYYTNLRWLGDRYVYSIPHHEAALPTEITHGRRDARQGFVGFMSAQYTFDVMRVDFIGPPTPENIKERISKYPAFGGPEIKRPGRAFQLTSFMDKSGVGIGVHIQVSPDAKYLSGTDGQKDIVAVWDVNTGELVAPVMLFRYDLSKKIITFSKIDPEEATKSKQFYGRNGVLLEHEITMGDETKAPQDMAICDSAVWDPRGRWMSVAMRRLGAAMIIDTKTWEPVHVVSSAEGQKNPEQVGERSWQFESIESTMHQQGFHPKGDGMCLMNNVVQNSVAVIDTKPHDDPTQWEAVHYIKGWGKYLPFHMGWRPPEGDIFFCNGWRPFASGETTKLFVIQTPITDLQSWEIIDNFDAGQDTHTPTCTPDGKFVTIGYGGWQGIGRAGFAIFDAETYKELIRYPVPAGPHSHVIVPHTLKDLPFQRCSNV